MGITYKSVPAAENELPCPHGYHWRGCSQCHQQHTVHKDTPKVAELPPLDVTKEDEYKVRYATGIHKKLCLQITVRERQLSAANAELERMDERFLDAISERDAANARVAEHAMELDKALLLIGVLEMQFDREYERAEAAESRVAELEFDLMRAISALSCIRVSCGIGEARTELRDALVIPAEVIHLVDTLRENQRKALEVLQLEAESKHVIYTPESAVSRAIVYLLQAQK